MKTSLRIGVPAGLVLTLVACTGSPRYTPRYTGNINGGNSNAVFVENRAAIDIGNLNLVGSGSHVNTETGLLIQNEYFVWTGQNWHGPENQVHFDGDQMMLPEVSPVPEPSTIALWTLAGVAGVTYRRRKSA